MSQNIIRSLILLNMVYDRLQFSSAERNGLQSRNLRLTQTIPAAAYAKKGKKDKKTAKAKGKDKKAKKTKTKSKKPKQPKQPKFKGKKGKKPKKVPKKCNFQYISMDSYDNGECDLLLNNKYCKYDGGDCEEFNYNYPKCQASKPSWVGDNFCDGAEYNTTECGFDGGDCLDMFDFGCSGAANGYCENMYNNAKCNFDGGDCRDFNERFPNCKVPDPSFVGDGLCDTEPYFTEECGYDGGDCDYFPVNCTAISTYAVGDGYCNLEYNTTECEYDGGDCILL